MITRLTMFMSLDADNLGSQQKLEGGYDISTCAICSTTKVCMPYMITEKGLSPLSKQLIQKNKETGCKHAFCYYCVSNAKKCPKC